MTDDFTNLGLKKEVLQAIESLGFKEPTDVQKKIIPLVLSKKNVAFTSATGTGKTLAFSIGFFSRLNKKMGIQMLVVVPTRELCQQVGGELKKFGDVLDFKVGMFFGGHPIKGDMTTIAKRLQVVVATPGRLIDHINSKSIKVGEVSSLVYDEADQMFDHGFIEDCIYIRSRVSSISQVILASATMTSKVDKFLKQTVKKFEFEKIGTLIPPSIVQDIIFCEIPEKKKLLVKFFQGEDFTSAMVFTNTKAKVESINNNLYKNNISCRTLSSDLDQKTRDKVLRDFRSKKFSTLVCTDVGARGLDIRDVEIVVNFDVPPRSELYIHRIGRTGRTGKKGYALTFVCPEDEKDFIQIEDEFDVHAGEVDHDFELVE